MKQVAAWFRKEPARIWYSVGVVLLAAALLVGLKIVYDGWMAKRNAAALLAAYDELYVRPDAPELVDGVEIQSLLDEQGKLIDALGGEYDIIGVLEVPSLELRLPVLATTTDKLLNVSLCKFTGPDIGQAGNLVIAGHNYMNDANFGHLDEVKIGARVEITDRQQQTFSYEVYQLETVFPANVDALSKYEGTSALTLLTCTDDGRQRLLVRCRSLDEKLGSSASAKK